MLSSYETCWRNATQDKRKRPSLCDDGLDDLRNGSHRPPLEGGPPKTGWLGHGVHAGKTSLGTRDVKGAALKLSIMSSRGRVGRPRLGPRRLLPHKDRDAALP